MCTNCVKTDDEQEEGTPRRWKNTLSLNPPLCDSLSTTRDDRTNGQEGKDPYILPEVDEPGPE
jgi:hypothetical protein